MEEIIVQAMLAERAREAARIRLAFEALQPDPVQGTQAAPSRFPAVEWLRQLASSWR